jgi:hypothetical protein
MEMRANMLISSVGLAGGYGETADLIATYYPRYGRFTLADDDGVWEAHWSILDVAVPQEQWNEMKCFINSCTGEGCPEIHTHFAGNLDGGSVS